MPFFIFFHHHHYHCHTGLFWPLYNYLQSCTYIYKNFHVFLQIFLIVLQFLHTFKHFYKSFSIHILTYKYVFIININSSFWCILHFYTYYYKHYRYLHINGITIRAFQWIHTHLNVDLLFIIHTLNDLISIFYTNVHFYRLLSL